MLAQAQPCHRNGINLPGNGIPLPGSGIPLPGSLIPREKTGQMTDCHLACEVSGSPGRVRTCDTLINSQLRYHCATGEFSTREVIIRITPRDATLILNFFSFLARTPPGPCPSLAPSLAGRRRPSHVSWSLPGQPRPAGASAPHSKARGGPAMCPWRLPCLLRLPGTAQTSPLTSRAPA